MARNRVIYQSEFCKEIYKRKGVDVSNGVAIHNGVTIPKNIVKKENILSRKVEFKHELSIVLVFFLTLFRWISRDMKLKH